MMKNLILTLIVFLSPTIIYASGDVHLDHSPHVFDDTESIKRGAKIFANYCFSCHSLKFMRYNRIGKDTGMTDEEIRDTLIFTTNKKGAPTKIGSLMNVSMTEEDAEIMFGTKVPDLSLTARAQGADWLYTYLRSFYIDPYTKTGMNNVIFSNVAMPHALWKLQGLQEARYKIKVVDGREIEVFDRFEIVKPGQLKPAEYNRVVADLVNFLVYVSEPVQIERKKLGWWVLGFLIIFFVFTYLLKKEYWKDVH